MTQTFTTFQNFPLFLQPQVGWLLIYLPASWASMFRATYQWWELSKFPFWTYQQYASMLPSMEPFTHPYTLSNTPFLSLPLFCPPLVCNHFFQNTNDRSVSYNHAKQFTLVLKFLLRLWRILLINNNLKPSKACEKSCPIIRHLVLPLRWSKSTDHISRLLRLSPTLKKITCLWQLGLMLTHHSSSPS